ncbi:hypothetical protein LRAMOSA04433 [Lichtheimia ramosa]|uniref:K Homology domain-containing protein n=1 Tax=Lichtheimia ramosa TaxID=688394 RepID=A0A077WYW7_9FUNG|nr:hypothetical protein LRAMOSA04433 [Lichtheimia ramosa]
MSQVSPTSTVSQAEQQAATLPPQQQDQTLERNQSSTSSDPALDDGGDNSLLTLRALLSSKEAGAVIGKGGKNIAELRDSTGVKVGISKVVQGVPDRVLTAVGTVESVAKAYGFVAQTLIDNLTGAPATPPISPVTHEDGSNIGSNTTLRLLISHNLMGTVIGRQGVKIKHIQDMSGVHMTASKSLLPQSTERVVEIRGTVHGIQTAIQEIGQCLLEDKERAYGTILYNPIKATKTSQQPPQGYTQQHQHRRSSSITRTGNGSDFTSSTTPTNGALGSQPSSRRQSVSSSFAADNPNIRTQHICIPSDMVGCIIGKGGAKISEIRRLSGSRISIAKMAHDETGERMFTIQGTPEANERALYLLYGQLENEKERRLQGMMQQENLLLEADEE